MIVFVVRGQNVIMQGRIDKFLSLGVVTFTTHCVLWLCAISFKYKCQQFGGASAPLSTHLSMAHGLVMSAPCMTECEGCNKNLWFHLLCVGLCCTSTCSTCSDGSNMSNHR